MNETIPDIQTDLRVLVIGLGRFGGGVGVTRWLCKQGAAVTVTDMAPKETLAKSVLDLDGLDVVFHLGGHGEKDLDDTDLVIVNPAVNKLKSAFFQEVLRRGLPWTTEMNLFCSQCKAKVVGITGTYGKSTTCTMLFEVMRAACTGPGSPFSGVHLGGNIGHSLLPELDEIEASDLVVLEMSNAQLEDLPQIGWIPQVGVVTCLSPNHLDRHGSYEAYVLAKMNMLSDPLGRSPIVMGEIDESARSIVASSVMNLEERVVSIEPADPPLCLTVPGPHNLKNAECVLQVSNLLGADESTARKVLESFRGLAHRLELVRSFAGVDYINDSKSTSPGATETALQCLDRPVVAIVGGLEKGVSLLSCAKALVSSCRAVVCTGESGPRFAAEVRSVRGGAGTPAVIECVDLEASVREAANASCEGDVVLYAPGGPSFDRYVNFEERGQHFSDLVNAL